jgi:hypothetical protein
VAANLRHALWGTPQHFSQIVLNLLKRKEMDLRSCQRARKSGRRGSPGRACVTPLHQYQKKRFAWEGFWMAMKREGLANPQSGGADSVRVRASACACGARAYEIGVARRSCAKLEQSAIETIERARFVRGLRLPSEKTEAAPAVTGAAFCLKRVRQTAQ